MVKQEKEEYQGVVLVMVVGTNVMVVKRLKKCLSIFLLEVSVSVKKTMYE